MKKTLAITLVLIMAFSAIMTFSISADDTAVPAENILFSEEDIASASDLSTLFKVVAPDPTNSENAEKLPVMSYDAAKGRLVVETKANTVLEVTGKGDALRNMAGSYIIEADMYIVENNYNGMVMVGFGINNQQKWSTGYYAQMNVYKNEVRSDIYVSEYNKDAAKQYGTAKLANLELTDTNGISTNKFSVKVVVDDTFVTWYIHGFEGENGVAYKTLKSLMTVKEGCPFFMLRSSCKYELDNIKVYKPAEAVETSDSNTTSNTTAATTPATTTAASTTTVTEASTEATTEEVKEGGCGSVIGMAVVLPVMAAVSASGIAVSKRKARRK